MTHLRKISMPALAIILGSPSTVLAADTFWSFTLGIGEQASDSEPKGENIAVDSYCPGSFDSGDGEAGMID